MNIEEIHILCKKYKIENYKINDDLTIDVKGNVYLENLQLNRLPLKFNEVTGNFLCHKSKLTSLEGSPKKVGGVFYCSNNKEQLSYYSWLLQIQRDEKLSQLGI